MCLAIPALLVEKRDHDQALVDLGGIRKPISIALVPEANVQKAVQEFSHPDTESPQKATAVALNEKPKPSANKAPPPEPRKAMASGTACVAGSAISSWLSRKAAATTSASVGSTRPPGKLTCPP